MRAFVTLLLVVVAGCFAAVATATTAQVKVCGTVVGANWVFPGTGGKVSGNKYAVLANGGVSCAFAKQWVVKLSSTKLAGKKAGRSYPLAGGPPGYTCEANPDAKGKVLAGDCKSGKNIFSWGVRP